MEVIEQKDFEEVKKPKKKAKKVLTIIAIVAVITVITAICIAIYSGVNAYKKPVDDVIHGINKADSLEIMEAIYTDDMLMVKRVNEKNAGTEWKDYLKENDDRIETRMEELDLKKAKCDIVAKEELSGSNLDEVKKFYENEYQLDPDDVKKVYRVEVNMTFKIKNGGDETPSGWLCVAKIKNEGWKFCPQCSQSHFDFIDEAINFQ